MNAKYLQKRHRENYSAFIPLERAGLLSFLLNSYVFSSSDRSWPPTLVLWSVVAIACSQCILLFVCDSIVGLICPSITYTERHYASPNAKGLGHLHLALIYNMRCCWKQNNMKWK